MKSEMEIPRERKRKRLLSLPNILDSPVKMGSNLRRQRVHRMSLVGNEPQLHLSKSEGDQAKLGNVVEQPENLNVGVKTVNEWHPKSHIKYPVDPVVTDQSPNKYLNMNIMRNNWLKSELVCRVLYQMGSILEDQDQSDGPIAANTTTNLDPMKMKELQQVVNRLRCDLINQCHSSRSHSRCSSDTNSGCVTPRELILNAIQPSSHRNKLTPSTSTATTTEPTVIQPKSDTESISQKSSWTRLNNREANILAPLSF